MVSLRDRGIKPLFSKNSKGNNICKKMNLWNLGNDNTIVYNDNLLSQPHKLVSHKRKM
jgi:hypothetical protein